MPLAACNPFVFIVALASILGNMLVINCLAENTRGEGVGASGYKPGGLLTEQTGHIPDTPERRDGRVVSPMRLLSRLALVPLCAWRGLSSAMSGGEISGSCHVGMETQASKAGEYRGTRGPARCYPFARVVVEANQLLRA